MQHHLFFLLSVLFSAASIAAQTTLYTTSRYPLTDAETGVQLFVLDEAQQLEQALFPALAGNEQQAGQQARQRMQQSDWKAAEARLALVTAWSLRVERSLLSSLMDAMLFMAPLIPGKHPVKDVG